jgi:hypothetical protein
LDAGAFPEQDPGDDGAVIMWSPLVEEPVLAAGLTVR